MDFSFYYHMNGMEEMVEILPFIMLYLGVFAVAYLIGLVFQLAQYIFRSLGLYTIARRRGLRRAWLVWIPFGCDWIVGSIVDQYQYLSRGKVSGKRKILLGLRLAVFACGLVLIGMAIAFVIRSSASGGNMLVAPAIGMVLVFLAMAVTSVVLTVFWHICRYHLYQSCDPKNGVAYMVLGLVFPVLDAVFFFICRNKDDGLPSREETVSKEPVCQEPEIVSDEEPAQEEVEPQAEMDEDPSETE